MTAVVVECQELQGQICRLADKIKDGLKPQAQELLEIEDAEYDRLQAIVRLEMAATPRADELKVRAKHKINTSLSGMNAGMAVVKDTT